MKRMSAMLFVLMLSASLGAHALTGSGDSVVVSLETVSPSLDSVSAVTERSLSASFSEPMRAPGTTTSGNYTVSGLGAGTLAAIPDAVSGSGPYTLTWSAGEMLDGETVTLIATGVQDAAGNPIDPSANSAPATSVGVAPVFSNLSASPAQASAGDRVTLTFTASETLDGDPEVTVNGHDVAWVSGAKAVDFTFTYLVQADDPLGMADVLVTGFDLAGNLGSLSSGDTLEIVEEQPGVPLYAWPAGLALLAAGIMWLARRRRPGAAMLVLALLLSASVFADPPSISDITVHQVPNGNTTQVEIGYGLTAPNGPCDITVWLSKDGGADGYIWPVTSVTGDIENVGASSDNLILWDIRADYPEEDIPNARIRLIADDGLVQHVIGVTSGGNGTVGGGGAYNQGATVTLSATPDANYHFVNWTEGGSEVSTDPAYSFTATAARTLAGNFAIDTYTLTYTAGANGAISGTSPQTVNYGESGTEVTAVADTSYLFDQWSDGVLTASRTDTNVTADITVTANFVPAAPLVTSFAINSGAAATAGPEVTLDNVATNSPTEYMASEASDFSGATWETYDTAPSFTLSSGEGGTKTVYFKVRNAAGESTVVSDTINLTERTILLPGDVPLVLVWVPSGSFQMGRYSGEVDSYSIEDPQHAVTLAYGFWMGKYEVTQQQWLAVQGSWPGTAPSSTYGLGNTYPAYNISWDDTKNFITTLNAHIVSSGQGPLTVRLPSEAEWEYACRAGTQTRFYWGDDLSYTQIGTYAWYSGNNSPDGTKPVGGKTPNAFGLYDMSGNVWEWCEDDYHGTYTGAPANGSAWIDSPRDSGRMIRGGYWNNNARYCRSAYRTYSTPGIRSSIIGFRLAAVQ